MRTTGASQLLDGERRIARVEEDRVHFLCGLDGLTNRSLIADVNHLDDRDPG